MEYRINLSLIVFNAERTAHLRGGSEIILPFVPVVGMHIKIGNMNPVLIKRVVWLSDEKCFHCDLEDGQYKFKFGDDVMELTEMLDILREAKKDGWKGLDRIYRDD
jgi:hypothetical protein